MIKSPKKLKERQAKMDIAIMLFKEGYPLRDIADRLQMSHTWVWFVVKNKPVDRISI